MCDSFRLLFFSLLHGPTMRERERETRQILSPTMWGGLHTSAEGLYDLLLKPALAHTLQTARALPPLLHLLVRRRLQRFVD